MSDGDKKKPDPEELPKDFTEFLRKKMEEGGGVFQIPLGVNQVPADEAVTDGSDEDDEARKIEALKFDLTPRQVKEHLDRYVIGQDDAKKALAVAVCDHYNHVRCLTEVGDGESSDTEGAVSEYVKQNVILLGPTGVGKTYLIRTIAQLIGVPFVKADVTKFSETGYVGGDVDDLVRELVRTAEGDIELAEYGIIFLDEIDKIATAGGQMSRDVSGRGVQTGLLKLLEETEVGARSPQDISGQFQEFFQMRRGKTSKQTINTRHILFVVSGAFSGIQEIIEKRLSQQNVGFGAMDVSEHHQEEESLLSCIRTEDFVDYGFEPEFIGRLPIRVALNDLSEEDLFHILTTAEGSIVKQHKENFRGYGMEVNFSDDALQQVATRALQEKTGARGLMTVLESALRGFKFHLPGTDIKKFLVTPKVVDNPEAALEELLASPSQEEIAREFAQFEVRQFERDFETRHGVRLDFDTESVVMASTVSAEIGLPIADYLESVFRDHIDFLRKIKEKCQRQRFPVTPQILNRPGEGLDLWLEKE